MAAVKEKSSPGYKSRLSPIPLIGSLSRHFISIYNQEISPTMENFEQIMRMLKTQYMPL